MGRLGDGRTSEPSVIRVARWSMQDRYSIMPTALCSHGSGNVRRSSSSDLPQNRFGYGRSEDAADTCLSRSSNKDVVQLERSEAPTDAGDSVFIRIGHGYGTVEPQSKRFRLF